MLTIDMLTKLPTKAVTRRMFSPARVEQIKTAYFGSSIDGFLLSNNFTGAIKLRSFQSETAKVCSFKSNHEIALYGYSFGWA